MRNLKKILAAIGVAMLVCGAAVAYAALWTGSTKEIESVADKFQPGDGWTLKSERIEPPRYICLNGGTCPQLVRTWKRDTPLTLDEFQKYIKESGWNFPISGDCLIEENMSGSFSVCDAKGIDKSYEVQVSYGSPDINAIEPQLSVLVNKIN